MTQFKVGDRVKRGMESGTVIAITDDGSSCDYLVEYDREGAGAHNGMGFRLASGAHGTKRNSLWCYAYQLAPIPSQTIVITYKDNTTLARLMDGKKVIKTAEAKCAPDDTFDFTTGAGLAFERLMGREKPVEPTQDKQESVKLYCIKASKGVNYFVKGKVYECKNKILYDDGEGCTTYTLEWLNDHFVPLVARPAKVGEWVYINAPYLANNVYEQGDIMQVTSLHGGNDVLINRKNAAGIDKLVVYREYLVLDGYNREPTCANCANWRSK